MMTPTLGYKSLAIRPRASQGFTLLELLLVLTILGMASILVVPNLGGLESRTFAAQVRQAKSLLNYSRRMAVVSGQPSTASFIIAREDATGDNADSNRQRVSSSRNSVGRWESSGTSVRYRDSTEREVEVDEQVEITFYPEGGSTGGTLLLSQDELAVNIVVDPFTGRISSQDLDEYGDVIE